MAELLTGYKIVPTVVCLQQSEKSSSLLHIENAQRHK